MTDRFLEQLQEALTEAYKVERELKGGGMSRVFVAVEQSLARTVVVKVLRPDLAADVNRERFRREIMLVAKLQHPHIVPVLSAGERGDLLWYTMPFIEGESLREAIARGGKFSVRSVVRVLHDILDALAYAHERGVIHRDIKPANILTHGSHALVTDFGVAKALSASMPHSGTTSAGMAIGTPAYMAPEQLAADPNADHRVDLYAVGLLAYELLTGEQPFAEPSPAETMAALLTRMPAPIAQLRDDVPAPLASLITRLLAKRPNERPQSAAEALAELDELVTPQGGGITSTVAQPAARRLLDTPIPREAAPGPRKSRLLIPLSIVGIAAAAAVAWLVMRDTAREPIANTTISQAPLTPGDTARASSLTSGAKGQTSLLTDTSSKVAAPPKTDAPKRDSARPQASRPRDTLGASKAVSSARPAAAPLPKGGAPPRAGTPLVTPTGKPKRLAILPARDASPNAQYGSVARALEDSLRRAAIALGYNLATDAELVRLLAQNDQNQQRRLSEELGIGALITPFVMVRERELQAQVTIIDVWRGGGLSERGRSDLDDPNGSLVVVRDVMRSLNRISWRQRGDARRAVVFDIDNPTANDTLAVFARLLTDSLRARTLRELGAGAQLVGDSAARATRDASERRFLALQLGAGAYVAGTLSRRGADSMRVRLSIRDITEERSFDSEFVIPFREPLPALPDILTRVVADLARVNWGPKGLPSVPPR